MAITFDYLPYEIWSEILERAAGINENEGSRFSYGISQAPEPLKDVPTVQSVIRGYLPSDVSRWISVANIRQVNAKWHDWAVQHALKELYLTRSPGSERWAQPRNLLRMTNSPSHKLTTVVYRDPYCSLRQTLNLFSTHPTLASCVRRIRFDGYHTVDAITLIFAILRYCTGLRNLALSWTALRYGSVGDWNHVVGKGQLGGLELLAIDLKQSRIEKETVTLDKQALASHALRFDSLRRLKIRGQSNHLPLVDDDLKVIARTATNLEQIQITGTRTIGTEGIGALVSASRGTLEFLDFNPAELPLSNVPRPGIRTLCAKGSCPAPAP